MKSYLIFIVLILVTATKIALYFLYKKPEVAPSYKMPEYPKSGFYGLVSSRAEVALPSPHSQLFLGMTVGLDGLNRVKKFKKLLITTGTVHVVVVSGFNINLVFEFVKKILGSTYKKRNLITALALTLGYALLSGFEPPVIRAWIMCAVANIGKYYGRVLEPTNLLIFTALIMLLWDSSLVESLSFQLSFMSSFGLLAVCPILSRIVALFCKKDFWFMQDLTTTLAANIAVWPLISFNFGRISPVSLLVNPIILWSVPVITVLGICLLPLMLVGDLLAVTSGYILYPLLDFFVQVVVFIGSATSDVSFEVPAWFVGAYYVLLLIIIKVLGARFVKKSNSI